MRGIRAGDLVAASLPPGREWLALLHEAWEAGAAVLPMDHRLPRAASDRILEAARPTLLVPESGEPERRTEGFGADADVALVMATSGTTGEPKLVELTHHALRAAVSASARRLSATADDPWLSCLPVSHIGGMLVLLRGVLLGAPLVVHREFDVSAFGVALSEGVRFASVVPTMLGRLLRRGVDLSSLRAILVGGSAMTQDGGATPVVTTYGMTETCGGVVYDGVPLDGVEVRIGEGERIEMNGPTIFRGYRLTDDAPRTDDGWFATGDAGAIEAGRLHLLGRLDDLIITGGHKVWPAEVESVLRRDASVAEVRVSGIPDAEWGNRVVAFVVPADPAAPPTLAGLRDLVADHLARYKAPRELVLIESLGRITGFARDKRLSSAATVDEPDTSPGTSEPDGE
jgi:O-succinylbenzoic acid--CoA ligase